MKVNIDESGKADITIDRWDTWNMNSTLAKIVHPMLLQLKQWNGIPLVHNEDVPAELHVGNGGKEYEDYNEAKWHWVLDEMIYAFSIYGNDDYGDVSDEKRKEDDERKANGLRLFGAYYDDFWE